MNLSLVDFLFYVFATISVGGGLAVVLSRNPVTAAMFMILSLVGVASLFVLLEAFFLAVLQVLVYAGAVMVLFLFIIMLMDVGPDSGKGAKMSQKRILSGFIALLGVGLLTVLTLEYSGVATDSADHWQDVTEETSAAGANIVFSKSVKSFGYGLFTKYMLPLQVAGFLLLAAMVGVIVLSKKNDDIDARIKADGPSHGTTNPQSEEA
jgi:NADH-quinone oxidoreductase subunit J